MHPTIQSETTVPSARNSIRRTAAARGLVLLVCALACFALSPPAQAAPRPTPTPTPPDGDIGNFNTAEGTGVLGNDTTGSYNTAMGFNAMYSNTTGNANTATGYQAMYSNTTGVDSVATGWLALYNNTAGFHNTALGFQTLFSNTIGIQNSAVGHTALLNNTTGTNNIALGYLAGSNLTTGDFNIDIGNTGVAAEGNTIRIGTAGKQYSTFVAGISGTAVVGDTVVVNGNGQLGTIVSSQRFKDEIKPMDRASEAVLALKPVTFRYKHELDPKQLPQFGLVAEQVEKVDPDLVARDAEGEVYTVRYEAVNAMLLNEFIKQHRRMQELETSLKHLTSTVAKQEAIIAAQEKEFQQLNRRSAVKDRRSESTKLRTN